MLVHRITNKKYNQDISGYGAQLSGGRYNPVGTPALYTAEYVSLACLEILVHVNQSFQTIDFSLLTIEVPDESILHYSLQNMPSNWTRPGSVNNPLEIGTSWLAECSYLVLRVPSVVVPFENNYVINPQHPLFKKVKIVDVFDFHFDRRLFKV